MNFMSERMGIVSLSIEDRPASATVDFELQCFAHATLKPNLPGRTIESEQDVKMVEDDFKITARGQNLSIKFDVL
jgi:hypothetical protein